MNVASKCALAVVLYFVLAYGSLYILNLDPPRWLERGVVVFALPMQGLTLPWLDVLKTLGLTEGEWIRQPSALGMILLVAFYGAVAWLVAAAIRRLFT